jgi:hypothetical protein
VPLKKRVTRLTLSRETVLQLRSEELKKVDGAYPPTAPRTCGCNESGVSQCVCSLDVSVCW